MIKSFEELHDATSEKIKNSGVKKVGIIYATNKKYISAIKKTTDAGFIVPTLIGPKNETEKLSTDFEIIDAPDPKQACQIAIEKASNGEFDFLLKCNIKTRDFVDLLYADQSGFVSRKTVLTHIGVLHTERYHKLMFVTDGGVIPEPNAAQMINVVQNATKVCNKLGNELPKAGLMAAVEAIYPAIQTTMLEAAIAKMSDRGQIKNVLIDGPLSFDVAIKTEVAKSKGITNSKVAGDTDIFAMSNMETANGTYKAMVMYAKAEAASVLYGAPVPIASSSAVDTSDNIFNSILLGICLT
ncbi:MAG: hypothetical protein GY865_04420 [candidate division Zixibacteria bacterium]|nr:hypothetical protein [candidate division Zixibacteria bacterium]